LCRAREDWRWTPIAADETISTLEKLAWWDWPVEKITRHLPAIIAADVKALPDE